MGDFGGGLDCLRSDVAGSGVAGDSGGRDWADSVGGTSDSLWALYLGNLFL